MVSFVLENADRVDGISAIGYMEAGKQKTGEKILRSKSNIEITQKRVENYINANKQHSSIMKQLNEMLPETDAGRDNKWTENKRETT